MSAYIMWRAFSLSDRMNILKSLQSLSLYGKTNLYLHLVQCLKSIRDSTPGIWGPGPSEEILKAGKDVLNEILIIFYLRGNHTRKALFLVDTKATQ
ncbi:hypothetical protein J6590_072021 [Homalodisca vitripennis]|nr:hypothetical protein J6590_096610 [Homalodisca vitripennis]KAG8305315.1 hypothetical protein J6590_072021 [Homalodisca vitripennis]